MAELHTACSSYGLVPIYRGEGCFPILGEAGGLAGCGDLAVS